MRFTTRKIETLAATPKSPGGLIRRPARQKRE
jgi:hypothetical protein